MRLAIALVVLAAAASARAGGDLRLAAADAVRASDVPTTSAIVRFHDVPWQPRGHSVKWKTGAIITFASIGVMAMGAAMLFSDWPSDWHHIHSGDALGISGLVIGCIGAGGFVLAGPALWVDGIGEGDDRLDRASR